MKTGHIFHVLFRTAPGFVLELIGKQPTVPYEFSCIKVKETEVKETG